jgi:hypothetical protein
MAMFNCHHCGDRHHVNDFCATGPMSMAFTVRSYSMPRTAARSALGGYEGEAGVTPKTVPQPNREG